MWRRYGYGHCFVLGASLINVILLGLIGWVIGLCIGLGLLGYTLVCVYWFGCFVFGLWVLGYCPIYSLCFVCLFPIVLLLFSYFLSFLYATC